MSKKNNDIKNMFDGPWQRLSGRRDSDGRLIETRHERMFPNRRTVDLAIDLMDPMRLRMLAEWVPLLEAERGDWAHRKLRYITRALARPRSPYMQAAVRAAIGDALATGPSAALRALTARPGSIVWGAERGARASSAM